MDQKLWFSFLLLHVIHVQSDHHQWYVNVPPKIPVVDGSCVVIGCSYGFPRGPSMQIEKVRTGYWKRGDKEDTVVSTTLPEWAVSDEYRRRSQFLGNLLAHNCTMQLNRVTTADAGSYYFRIEMLRSRKYSYINYPVYIDVIRNPEPPSIYVHVQFKVTVSCYVIHSCPTDVPVFSWSKSGRAIPRTKKLNSWQWKSSSVLTLPRRRTAFNQTLNCTVRYTGGRKAMQSVILTA